MHYIEHIIEPTKLLLTWQDIRSRARYTVAEINRIGEQITLQYLINSSDFQQAKKLGFTNYPAFSAESVVHATGVLDALMKRLPPNTRNDYPQYLESLRIKNDTPISDFALLGYSGARLPSDHFAIVNSFENIDAPFEFLLEVAGYQYYSNRNIEIDEPVIFQKDFDSARQEEVIKIFTGNEHIGYVTRALLPNFQNWLDSGRVISAWVEKKNGSPDQPVLYVYVEISATSK